MSIYKKKVVIVLTAMLLLGVLSSLAFAVEVAPGVQLHGYMQNRVYLAPGATAEYRAERVSVSATAALPSESTGYVELYYHPWANAPAGGTASGIYLESAYYDTPFGDGRLRIGKGRRMTFGITPAYPNRKTSNYGIVAEACTQDRIQGVQYMLQKDALDFGMAVHSGYRLGQRRIGEIPGDNVRNATHQVQHLAFRDSGSGGGSPDEMSQKLEISARLGGKWPSGIKAGISYSLGRLDNRDLANLKSTTGGTILNAGPGGPGSSLVAASATSKARNVGGLDFTYTSPEGFVAQGEYYKAKVSDLKYKAWNLLAGFNPPQGWKFFVRYARHDMPSDILSSNPLSWDVKQISISAVQPLRKALWIQYEYEINSESPPVGTSSVKNNLFFVELFAGF